MPAIGTSGTTSVGGRPDGRTPAGATLARSRNLCHPLAVSAAPYIALALSGASLLVAVTSLCWTIYTAVHLNAARISVVTSHSQLIGAAPYREIFVVTVTNTGRAPTKVLNIMLGFGKRRSRLQGALPVPWRGTEAVLLTGAIPTLSSALPVTLAPGDDASLYYPADLVRRAMAEQGVTTLFGRATSSTAGSRTSSRVSVRD